MDRFVAGPCTLAAMPVLSEPAPSGGPSSPGTPSSTVTSRGAPRPIRTPSSSARSMLQQTQASRVADRFERFLARFPDATSLATAAPADRARRVERARIQPPRAGAPLRCRRRRLRRDGWPRDVDGLRRLPGVGPYTARAIASLAFGTPVGVVDTNVRRWLLRRFGGPDEPRRLQELADALAAPGHGDEVGGMDSREHGARRIGVPLALAALRRVPRRARAVHPAGSQPAIPVARQAPLRGSTARLPRGAAARPGRTRRVIGSASSSAERGSSGDGRRRVRRSTIGGWRRIVDDLEREGLLHRARRGIASARYNRGVTTTLEVGDRCRRSACAPPTGILLNLRSFVTKQPIAPALLRRADRWWTTPSAGADARSRR